MSDQRKFVREHFQGVNPFILILFYHNVYSQTRVFYIHYHLMSVPSGLLILGYDKSIQR